MPGILGIPAIPTAAELQAAGVALEDQAFTQAAALIAQAVQGFTSIAAQVMGAVNNLENTANNVPANFIDEIHGILDRVSGSVIDYQGIPLFRLTIPPKK